MSRFIDLQRQFKNLRHILPFLPATSTASIVFLAMTKYSCQKSSLGSVRFRQSDTGLKTNGNAVPECTSLGHTNRSCGRFNVGNHFRYLIIQIFQFFSRGRGRKSEGFLRFSLFSVTCGSGTKTRAVAAHGQCDPERTDSGCDPE